MDSQTTPEALSRDLANVHRVAIELAYFGPGSDGWKRLHPEEPGEEVSFEAWEGCLYRIAFILRICPELPFARYLFVQALRIAIRQVASVLAGHRGSVQQAEMFSFDHVLRRLLIEEATDIGSCSGLMTLRPRLYLGDNFAELRDLVERHQPLVRRLSLPPAVASTSTAPSR